MATAFSLDKVASASPLARARLVENGLPVSAVRDLVANRIVTVADVARVVGPRRTLDRRLKDDQALTRDEGDRFVRFVAVLGLAEKVFGTSAEAMAWLREPKAAFEDERPIDLLRTDAGARAVENLLQQARHGMLA